MLTSCAKKETSEDYSAKRTESKSEDHASLKHFNYEDAKKLQPGEFVGVTRGGGAIFKVAEGYIFSFGEGTVYLTDEEFKGKEE